MRKRLRKVAALLVSLCVLLIICVGCKDTSQSESSKATSAPDSSSTPVVETLSTEQVLESEMIKRVSASGHVPEEEREFMEEYYSYFGEVKVADPLELLMDTYASCSEVQVELLDDNTALVHVDVPNLPEILKSAISSLSEGEKSAGNASELIQMAAQKILASGEFERKTTDVTVSYTLSADGAAEIVESPEYLDALYGGLLTSAEELFAQTEESADGVEVSE